MTCDDVGSTRAALERLLDVAGETAARQILADVGRAGAQVEFERLVVRRMAVRLLEARAPRLIVRDRLISRGVSERTAYRVIDEALGLGRRSSANEAGSLAEDSETLAASQPMERTDGTDLG